MTDLESCFEAFRDSAFRLESLPSYDAADNARFAAYCRHEPLPDRSVRTSPWLRRIALTTVAGKSWQRAHVIDEPLTDYQQFELIAYAESAAAGEEIRIADRASSAALVRLASDFWLFDAGTPAAVAALMTYDHCGRYLGSEITSDPDVVRSCQEDRDIAVARSIPLSAYLAARRKARATTA